MAWAWYHFLVPTLRRGDRIGSLILFVIDKGESWRQEGHRWPWQRKVDERDGQRDKQEEMGRDQEVKGDISGMASPTTTAAGDSDVVKGKQTESDEKSVGGA